MTDLTCDHPSFMANVDVNRLTDVDGGPVNAFSADIKINCAACGEPFVFFCRDGGVLPDRPAVSVDGQELRAPIAPSGNPEAFRADVGFRVSVGPKPRHPA